ncbi:MAG TPA: hypothetical protein VGQ83_17825 [Polyangia bacterium]|jgi:DNA-binding beta-propeller fold protein YncE
MVAVVLAVAGVSGCGATQKPSAVPEVLWPPPPEVPRFKLARVIKGEADYEPPAGWWRRTFLGARKPGELFELKQPFGIACHPAKRVVYVAERKQARIIAFDEDTKKVRFYGDAVGGKLGLVLGIAVDDAGVVYAVDQRSRRVYAYNVDGSLLRVYGQHEELKRPTGVAVDRARGRLYVADLGPQAIIVLDLATGSKVATWGKGGRGQGEFAFPGLLALDRRGNLLVADQMNFRIQVLSPEGAFVRALGGPGDRPGSFFRLKGVAVDSENRVYAVDEAFANVQVFQSDGQLLLFFGQGGDRPGEFRMPVGACVTPDDVIWVAEAMGSRIQGIRFLRNAHVPSRAPASQPASAPHP